MVVQVDFGQLDRSSDPDFLKCSLPRSGLPVGRACGSRRTTWMDLGSQGWPERLRVPGQDVLQPLDRVGHQHAGSVEHQLTGRVPLPALGLVTLHAAESQQQPFDGAPTRAARAGRAPRKGANNGRKSRRAIRAVLERACLGSLLLIVYIHDRGSRGDRGGEQNAGPTGGRRFYASRTAPWVARLCGCSVARPRTVLRDGVRRVRAAPHLGCLRGGHPLGPGYLALHRSLRLHDMARFRRSGRRALCLPPTESSFLGRRTSDW
jgi:hypothetical protein